MASAMIRPTANLHRIKLLHTAIWAVVALCVVAIPLFGWFQMYAYVLLLTGVVVIEALVLVFNGWRCPLTNVAAQFTDDRSANFDIYLPRWLARNNKLIFGALFLVGEIVVLLHWRGLFVYW